MGTRSCGGGRVSARDIRKRFFAVNRDAWCDLVDRVGGDVAGWYWVLCMESRKDPETEQRYLARHSYRFLAELFLISTSAVRRRIVALNKAGLIDYEPGSNHWTGHLRLLADIESDDWTRVRTVKKRDPNQITRAKQFLDDVDVCAYCGETPVKDGKRSVWEIDHVVPISRGGLDELCNMVKACRWCNRTKNADLWTPLPGAIYADGHVETNLDGGAPMYAIRQHRQFKESTHAATVE